MLKYSRIFFVVLALGGVSFNVNAGLLLFALTKPVKVVAVLGAKVVTAPFKLLSKKSESHDSAKLEMKKK